MAIYKSRDKWRAELNVDGRRIASRTFARKLEAEVWLAERKAATVGRGTIVVGATVEDAITRFVEFHLPNLKPSSVLLYRREIDTKIRPYFKYMRLDNVTVSVLEDFKRQISRGVKPRTANLTLLVLSVIFSKAVRYGLVSSLPAVPSRYKAPQAVYRWWESRSDVHKFLEEARKSIYFLAYLISLECGLRYGEVMGLRVEDIDLERGTISVRRQWVEGLGTYTPTKTGGHRTVSFTPGGELSRALGQAIKNSKEGRLIVGRDGKAPKRSVVAASSFDSIQVRAGVPKITFHGLRHTFASWYMREHDNLWALKDLLGHADVKTSMIYAHHGSSRLHKPLGLDLIPHKSPTLRVVGGGT